MYVIAFLDRSNVSFAQKEFEVDFGISAAAYAFGAGLFFVGYAIFEVPSNLLLHEVGARWWLARIMVELGHHCGLMFVQGAEQFLRPALPARCRRGGLPPRHHPLPHLLDPRAHLSRARAYFYMGIAIASILGIPLFGELLSSTDCSGFVRVEVVPPADVATEATGH